MKLPLLFLLALPGCVLVRVVPTTNDAAAWRAPWVEQARVEHERGIRALACDPLMRTNMDPLGEPPPGCEARR